MPATLQASLWHQENKKLRKLGATARVTGVTCVEQSRQAATCAVDLTDGASRSLSVVISASGDTYVTS